MLSKKSGPCWRRCDPPEKVRTGTLLDGQRSLAHALKQLLPNRPRIVIPHPLLKYQILRHALWRRRLAYCSALRVVAGYTLRRLLVSSGTQRTQRTILKRERSRDGDVKGKKDGCWEWNGKGNREREGRRVPAPYRTSPTHAPSAYSPPSAPPSPDAPPSPGYSAPSAGSACYGASR